MRGITEQQRRIEGRQVWTEFVVRALEGGPGRVEDESTQYDKNGNRCCPPRVAAPRLAKMAAWQCGRCFRHAGKLLRDRRIGLKRVKFTGSRGKCQWGISSRRP